MLIPRALFALCCLFSIFFFTTHLSNLTISTDIRDLAPDISQNQDTQEIIDKLTDNIQQRFILLVQSNNTDDLHNATRQLAEQLHSIAGLTVTGEDSTAIKTILDQLKPYQHQLLTDAQRQALETKSIKQLATEAEEKLYQLNSATRLLPFNEDPLGYLSDYALVLLSSLTGEAKDELSSQVVSVRITNNNRDMSTQTALYNAISAIEQQIETEFSVDILHSGLFFFAAEAAISSKADVELISTGSTICITLLLLFVFRSLWPLFLPAISIVLGVAFAIAVNYFLYGSLHILTIVFGASLIGIVIDYSLHFFYHNIPNKSAVTGKKNHHLFTALLLSLITSFIGYGALGLSDLVALRKIALFSCCGLLMAWLSVIVLGQYMLQTKREPEKVLLPKILHAIFSLLPKKRNIYITVIAALLISFAFLFYFIGFNTNDDPRLFYRVSTELLDEEKKVSTILKQYEPGRYFIIQGDKQQAVRASLIELKQQVNRYNPEATLYSILDVLPSIDSQHYYYTLQDKLYQDEGVIATLYNKLNINHADFIDKQANYNNASGLTIDPVVLTATSDDLLPTWFKHNKHIANIILISQGSDTAEFEKIANDLPNVDYINSIDLATDILKAQRHSAAGILVLAFVLIGILLFLYYRNTASLLSLLIPLSAILVTLLYLLISQETLSLFHIMALFLVLGLGMDYVIFSKEMTEHPSITQQAILLSALTTSVSFGFLSISNIPIAQSFGLTILIGNAVNLVGTLIYSHFLNKHNFSKGLL